MAHIKFEKKSDVCTIAFIECCRMGADGRVRRTFEAVRAILETKDSARTGWRIDRTVAIAGAWMPWEAVNANSYSSLAQAKVALRAFAAEGRLLQPSKD